MIGYPLLNYLAIFALDLSKFEFVLRFFKYVVRYLITCHSSQFIPSTYVSTLSPPNSRFLGPKK